MRLEWWSMSQRDPPVSASQTLGFKFVLPHSTYCVGMQLSPYVCTAGKALRLVFILHTAAVIPTYFKEDARSFAVGGVIIPVCYAPEKKEGGCTEPPRCTDTHALRKTQFLLALSFSEKSVSEPHSHFVKNSRAGHNDTEEKS